MDNLGRTEFPVRIERFPTIPGAGRVPVPLPGTSVDWHPPREVVATETVRGANPPARNYFSTRDVSIWMQITGVTQHHCSHPLGGSFEPTWIPGYAQGTHEVEVFEVHTDAGITGIAASPSFAGGLDYETPLELFLVGQDPHDVEGIRRRLASINLIGPRPWHLEMALWDVIGKDAGKPVYELLGGTGDAIPAYASTGEVQPADERLAYVEERVGEGFEAVKLRVVDPGDLDVVRAVRSAFPDLTLMVDANKGWAVRVLAEEPRWGFDDALRAARELETIDAMEGSGGIAWLEEPLPRHDFDGYARLRDATDVPIAGGEFNDGVYQFHEFLDRDALDVIQPDVALATGIRGGLVVADRAESEGVDFVPHTWTNGVGLAANLHVMAAVGAPWCEYPLEPPWTAENRDFLLEEGHAIEDGFVSPPNGPGLGVALDESVIQ